MIEDFRRPDAPARLPARVADQGVTVFEDVVRRPADDGGNLLLFVGVGDQVVIDVPGEVVAVHLVAAGIPLAPDLGIDWRAEPNLVGLAGYADAILQVHADAGFDLIIRHDHARGVAGDAGQA